MDSSLSSGPCPFLPIHDDDLTPSDVLLQYSRYGFLWVRPTSSSPSEGTNENDDDGSSILEVLRNYHTSHPNWFSTRWSVENRGKYECDDDLSPSVVLNDEGKTKGAGGRYYVSTILSPHPDLSKLFVDLLLPYPNGEPKLLDGATYNGGCWLFIGSNPATTSSSSVDHSSSSGGGDDTNGRKRKRPPTIPECNKPLLGRAEHIDEVTHSGTWHYQLAGTKTWVLRPDPNAAHWKEYGMPNLSEVVTEEGGGAAVVERHNGVGRLRINVQMGDWFVLNTRVWYHRTELDGSGDGALSVSLARDFHLKPPALTSDRDVAKGQVVLDEDDIPETIPRSSEPNCALAEVELEEEDDEGQIVLLALRDVKAGEALTVALDDVPDEDEGTEEKSDSVCNAPKSVDPRVIAKRDFVMGEVVLRGEEIPEEILRSLEPTCEVLLEGQETAIQLRALRDIKCGEEFCVAPEEGEQYEKVEIDLGSGEYVSEDTNQTK